MADLRELPTKTEKELK